MDKPNIALELTISNDEFRERASKIERRLGAALIDDTPLFIAESLVALHIVRRRLERTLAWSDLPKEKQAILLEQIQKQQDSFDATIAQNPSWKEPNHGS